MALSVEDPLAKYDLSTKTEQLDMAWEQGRDPHLRQVRRWMVDGEIPDTKYANHELQTYHRHLQQLWISPEGVIYRKFYKHNGRDHTKQLVIPQNARNEVLLRLHYPKTEGHRGVRKTTEECRHRFYWPHFQDDIRDFIENCMTCIQTKRTPDRNLRPPLQPVTSTTSFPGEMMQIDLIGPFKPTGGFTQVLTAVDVFTKYIFAIPLRRITAQNIVNALTTIFLRHSYVPEILLTDKGTQLTAELMQEVTQLMDIELRHATVKHPQTIGLLERAHASIKKHLKIYENESHTNWHQYLDYAVFAHNISWNPQTRTTPSDLFHGYTPLKAIDIRFQAPDKERGKHLTTQQIQDNLRRLHGLQKQDLVMNYLKYKKHYDKTACAIPLKLHSFCLLLNPVLDSQKQSMHKMQPKWIGTYRVEQKCTNENYIIREIGTNYTQNVHRIRLRPYSPHVPLQDLAEIDAAKFMVDPTIPTSHLEPAIFDAAKDQLNEERNRYPHGPTEHVLPPPIPAPPRPATHEVSQSQPPQRAARNANILPPLYNRRNMIPRHEPQNNTRRMSVPPLPYSLPRSRDRQPIAPLSPPLSSDTSSSPPPQRRTGPITRSQQTQPTQETRPNTAHRTHQPTPPPYHTRARAHQSQQENPSGPDSDTTTPASIPQPRNPTRGSNLPSSDIATAALHITTNASTADPASAAKATHILSQCPSCSPPHTIPPRRAPLRQSIREELHKVPKFFRRKPSTNSDEVQSTSSQPLHNFEDTRPFLHHDVPHYHDRLATMSRTPTPQHDMSRQSSRHTSPSRSRQTSQETMSAPASPTRSRQHASTASNRIPPLMSVPTYPRSAPHSPTQTEPRGPVTRSQAATLSRNTPHASSRTLSSARTSPTPSEGGPSTRLRSSTTAATKLRPHPAPPALRFRQHSPSARELACNQPNSYFAQQASRALPDAFAHTHPQLGGGFH